jgi:von Willebrand factor type A domain
MDVQPSRRAIVLVTDGDNDSHLDINQAIEIAQRNASLVYVISTNKLASGGADSPDAAMKELSEATGGNLFHARAQSNLKNAFSNMQKELRRSVCDRLHAG